MTTKNAAVANLVQIISTGDLDAARNFADDHAGSLTALRYDGAAQADVAHACNRWGAPMVWPWGDRHVPTAAQRRVLVAIRAGRPWRASEDTVAVLIATGVVQYSDGALVAA